MQDACAKWDFLRQNGVFEKEPYIITVDANLVSTATMPTTAAGPEGGGEDGYRTVLEIIACSTRPCIEVFAADDSLAPTG